jgi:hypothetical protein
MFDGGRLEDYFVDSIWHVCGCCIIGVRFCIDGGVDGTGLRKKGVGDGKHSPTDYNDTSIDHDSSISLPVLSRRQVAQSVLSIYIHEDPLSRSCSQDMCNNFNALLFTFNVSK